MTELRASTSFAPPTLSSIEAQQSRFALRVTAALTQRNESLSVDVNERLRFAREQALERARALRAAESQPVQGWTRSGAMIAAFAGSGWWIRVASVLPVLALLVGLMLIQHWQDQTQISDAAEVDAALLADDLPPNAYSDAGFAEFLKASNE